MRLDKYLKVSRLIKRRTVANEACDNERVSVNGRPARASYEVKVGDVIAIRFGERTLTVEGYTDSGRVAAMLVGGRRVEGAAFRQALGLRSTWFTLSMDEQAVTFHQQGYGHGVGMSQAGANSMAADGADYRSILMHYYPGVAIEKR